MIGDRSIRWLRLFAFCAVMSLGGGMARADTSKCAETEKWCSHTVATFCANEACSSIREAGECVPKEKSCDAFWCGNRQCQTGWLISKDVCCVYFPNENVPEYACAMSEYSCRGNTGQLPIRPTLASRDIHSSR